MDFKSEFQQFIHLLLCIVLLHDKSTPPTPEEKYMGGDLGIAHNYTIQTP